MINNIVRKIVVLAVSLAAGRLSSFLMALVPLGLFSHPLIYTSELKNRGVFEEIRTRRWVTG